MGWGGGGRAGAPVKLKLVKLKLVKNITIVKIVSTSYVQDCRHLSPSYQEVPPTRKLKPSIDLFSITTAINPSLLSNMEGN